MTLFMPILFVCSMTFTNTGHCEVVQIPEVTTTVEGCTRILRRELDRLKDATPRPFPQLPGDWLIRGHCNIEVLYEPLLAQGE